MKIKLSHISFEVSTQCNLRCQYCYNIWKMPGATHPGEVTYRKAHKAIRKIYKRADVSHFTFTGGEPLLFPRLAELVLYVRLKGSTVTIISNGNAGTKDDFSMLVKLGVGLFEFPYHSIDSEIHDRIAGVTGAHAKSSATIDMVQKLGGRVVAVIVLTKYNIEQLEQTLLKLKEMGVAAVMMNRFNIGGEGLALAKELMPDIEELRHGFSVAESVIIKEKISLTSNVCTPVCVLNPKSYPHIGFGHCSAEPYLKPITIDHYGNLRLCNHSPIVAGNIFKERFEEIFNSEYSKSWGGKEPDFCKDCNEYATCFAGCRAASEQVGWGLNREDPIIELLNINR